MPHPIDSTSSLFSGNSVYIEELFERYLQNPGSVDESWRQFFKDSTNGAGAAQRSASWAKIKSQVIGATETPPPASAEHSLPSPSRGRVREGAVSMPNWP